MCGIAGFLRSSPFPEGAAQRIVTKMMDAISYRGPDGGGSYVDTTSSGECIALGHRRLAIIDLEGGHQPMQWADRNLVISFNGEIYNFQELKTELEAGGAAFSTKSDTEVILAAYERYGWRCVEKLRGMFAFALWDARKRTLLLARDRFGKKPLYYAELGDGIAFASEAKSLLAVAEVDRSVDARAVWDYFGFRYVPGPRTLFKGIKKLPPGCVLLCTTARRILERYYTPPDGLPGSRSEIDDAEGTKRFAAVLNDAVRLRLVSDVPFGAFLSGGIDSSVVVALMAPLMSEPVKTFSVSFSEGGYSEAHYSRLVAQRYGTAHHELVVSAGDLMQHLSDLIRFRDAPVAEPSDIPIYLLSREARRQVKMVLTGEGSDEVLGGYPKHVYERFAAAYHVIPGLLRNKLVLPLVDALPYSFHRLKTAAHAIGAGSWNERMVRWFGAVGDSERARLVHERGPSLDAEFPVDPIPAKSNSPLKRILAFDQLSWLPDNLLERGDRMTMAASLEARMPFLDHELAGVISALPDRFRVRRGTTKWVLREIARKLLPSEIVERPKVGFKVPVNVWFRAELRQYLVDTLLGRDAKSIEYYRRPALDRVLQEHFDGRQNHEKLIWTMLSLELWHRQYA